MGRPRIPSVEFAAALQAIFGYWLPFRCHLPGGRLGVQVDWRRGFSGGGSRDERGRIGGDHTGWCMRNPARGYFFVFRIVTNAMNAIAHAAQASADMLTIPPPTQTVVDEPRANAPTQATTIPIAAMAAIAIRAMFTLSRHHLAGADSRLLAASGVVSAIRLSMTHILTCRDYQTLPSRCSNAIISKRGTVGNLATLLTGPFDYCGNWCGSELGWK